MSQPSHAYSPLTPDVVIDALEQLGLRCDGRLMALSSYENRVYLAHLEDNSAVVVKFYRPERWSQAQVLEEHRFALQLQAAEVPIVAPLVLHGQTLHTHAGFWFSVSPRRGGRTPELDDFETLEWIGRFLARIHSVGAAEPFAQRPALDVHTFGHASMHWLLEHEAIPLDVQSAWRDACAQALKIIANYAIDTPESSGFSSSIARIRLHGDCHPGNILWTPIEGATDPQGRHTPGGPHFVDLDDARSGPAVQDLWMLLSGERAQRTAQLGALIDGYEQFRPFDRRELALIEPLRTLRLVHYSAWLAQRWHDPTFPIHFPHFGSSDYWQGQVSMLHEQIQAMDAPPLVA